MTVSFGIAAGYQTGPRRWWLVRIHDDLASLRRAANAYDTSTDFSECYGCCHSVWHQVGDQRVYSPRGYAGIIRFAADHLSGEVIAHELLHAAVSIYRMNVEQEVHLGWGVTDREEQLAYLLGELYADFESRFRHPLAM